MRLLHRIVVLGFTCGLLLSLTVSRSSPASGQVRLVWEPPVTNADGNPLLDLAGFKVYYWQDDWDVSKLVDIGKRFQTSFTFTHLEVGRTYNFAVSAYDGAGNESELSEVVSVTVGASSSSSGGGGCTVAM